MRMFVLLAVALLAAFLVSAVAVGCAPKEADAATPVTAPVTPVSGPAKPAPAKPEAETAACAAESACSEDACATCPHRAAAESSEKPACAGNCDPESCADCAAAKKADDKTESAAACPTGLTTDSSGG